MEQTESKFDVLSRIIANFDFDRVYAYMVLTKWKWRDQQPDLEELRMTATTLLFQVADPQRPYRKEGDEGWMVGTGGFYAYRFIFDGKVCYKLTFEPFHYSNF